MKTTPRFPATAAILLGLALAPASCDKGPAPSPAGPAAVSTVPLTLTDCAVIGASVSAGAEVQLPGLTPKMLVGDANLADAFAAITSAPAPASFADLMFFTGPDRVADHQLAAAKALKPRIVFALDYLFWHAYGAQLTDDQRAALLERGLGRVGSLDCTVVISDLPNMAHAVGFMLFQQQVPSKAVLDKLNARIESWAAERKNIVLLSLRGVVDGAMSKQTVTLGGHQYAGEHSRGLLVENGLHATADGLIGLALEALDVMSRRGLLPPNSTWDHDPESIKTRLTQTKLAEEKAKPAPGAPPSPAPAR